MTKTDCISKWMIWVAMGCEGFQFQRFGYWSLEFLSTAIVLV